VKSTIDYLDRCIINYLDHSQWPEDAMKAIRREAQVPDSQSIECRSTIRLIAEQKSQIDAHCGREKQVIRTSQWETEADLSVRIEPDDFRVYPTGSDGAFNPYQQRRRAKQGSRRGH
jgi:hypothetical protein